MMLYKALTTFSGAVSMAAGETREISDAPTAEDLLRAGYIEPAAEEKPPAPRGKKPKQ